MTSLDALSRALADKDEAELAGMEDELRQMMVEFSSENGQTSIQTSSERPIAYASQTQLGQQQQEGDVSGREEQPYDAGSQQLPFVARRDAAPLNVVSKTYDRLSSVSDGSAEVPEQGPAPGANTSGANTTYGVISSLSLDAATFQEQDRPQNVAQGSLRPTSAYADVPSLSLDALATSAPLPIRSATVSDTSTTSPSLNRSAIATAKLQGDGPRRLIKVFLPRDRDGFVTLHYPNGTTMRVVQMYVITKRKLPEDVYSLHYMNQVDEIRPEMTVGQLTSDELQIVGTRIDKKEGVLRCVAMNTLRRRVWKPRWFVLERNRLQSHVKQYGEMIYSLELDSLNPAAITVAEASSSKKKKASDKAGDGAASQKKKKKPGNDRFQVTIPTTKESLKSTRSVGGKQQPGTQDLVINFRAKDAAERDEWVRVLRRSIENHRKEVSMGVGPATVAAGAAKRTAEGTSSSGAASEKVSIDDFELLFVVGKGSFGKVLQVRHKVTGQIYAMKVLDKRVVAAHDEIEAAVTERNVLEKLVHPFLVNLYYSFQSKDKLYFVMDFINGGELLHYLDRGTQLDPERIRFYTAEIVLAIEYLHSCGVIYRDLKPENVLINFDGHVVLTDFGLSKMNLNTDDDRTMTLCGTPDYIAPEIIMSEYTQRGYSKAVDIWSLGCLLFEMLTGNTPFYSQDMQETFTMIAQNDLRIPPSVTDPATIDLLQGLLRKQEAERFTLKQIKTHAYFSGIDWIALVQKQVSPPFVPDVKSKSDVSKIDMEFLQEAPTLEIDFSSEEEVEDFVDDDAEMFFSGFNEFVAPAARQG